MVNEEAIEVSVASFLYIKKVKCMKAITIKITDMNKPPRVWINDKEVSDLHKGFGIEKVIYKYITADENARPHHLLIKYYDLHQDKEKVLGFSNNVRNKQNATSKTM